MIIPCGKSGNGIIVAGYPLELVCDTNRESDATNHVDAALQQVLPIENLDFFRELHRLRGTYACPFPDFPRFAVSSGRLCMVCGFESIHNRPEVDATLGKQ